ncbi:Phospholipid ABC transporter substrate-binding protein MlaD [hydrothermal vent metagenome]|uniref:Phospholipid ABC transporter substrate-binding protein MlaD n=1 Tax=hydrothermal vent metagenome TaxID=652676 RepID=A0A3B1BD01_9ZZZZ
MTSRLTEIWVGIFVAIGMAALFMLAMKVSNLSTYNSGEGFDVIAHFDDASGLKVRSPVTMAGVRIGRVKDIRFDDQTFEAVVTMNLEQGHNSLPEDTSASIYTAGLLGEKYVGLEPGAGSNHCEELALEAELEGESFNPADCVNDDSNNVLHEGSRITLTQSSMVLEKLIGQFVSRFLSDSDVEEKK